MVLKNIGHLDQTSLCCMIQLVWQPVLDRLEQPAFYKTAFIRAIRFYHALDGIRAAKAGIISRGGGSA